MLMLILTAAQANAARVKASEYTALDPIQLPDTRWALPLRVLLDAGHPRATRWAMRNLPVENIAFDGEPDESDLAQRFARWKAGQDLT